MAGIGLGEIISIADTITDLADLATPSKSTGGKGPVRGARLEYNVSELGGRLLIKEPFGFWLGLTPVYPEYGTFKEGTNIKGKKFTKRGGFRFKSYIILLKPGTKIKVPKAKASEQRKGEGGTEERQLGNIAIGVTNNVSVNEFIEFLKKNKQAKNINGLISPTLRKYQWAGVLHRAS